MPFSMSRRLLVAARALAAPFAHGIKAGEPARERACRSPLSDPRAFHVDVGSPDALWRVFLGIPAVPLPPEGYSAIIAGDGNASFPFLWHARERLAAAAPLAAIGIGYRVGTRLDVVRRWFDLTSRHRTDARHRGSPPRGPGDRETGGREAFARAIEGLILPELARRLPLAQNDLTVYGHFLGWLFTLHMLFTRPKLFARFCAADPSLLWIDSEALREAAAFAVGLSAGGGAGQEGHCVFWSKAPARCGATAERGGTRRVICRRLSRASQGWRSICAAIPRKAISRSFPRALPIRSAFISGSFKLRET